MTNDERVRFQLLHSISIPGAPELHKYMFVHGDMTLHHLYRQKSEGVVELYIIAFIDLMGDMRDDAVNERHDVSAKARGARFDGAAQLWLLT